MFMSMMHVLCPFCMSTSMQHDHVHFHVAHPCPPARSFLCCMSMSMSMLHIHAHLHAARTCPLCVSMSRLHIMQGFSSCFCLFVCFIIRCSMVDVLFW
jgi:hypothetical protein